MTRLHAIVSDISIPGQDGYAFMKRVRELGPELATIPSIALTAYTRGSACMKARWGGVTTHPGKLVDPDDLVRAVAALAKPAPA